MDLRQMRHFVAVAEELHFSKAAARLNMAQPPLSQSIKRLEDDLGTALFERSRRGVTLTRTGQLFLEEARRTLMQADHARNVVAQAMDLERDRLNIGLIGPALYRLLPALLSEFRTRWPDTEITLHERNSYEQLNAILEGSYDVGFVYNVVELMDGADKLIVERAPMVAAVHRSSPLAARTSLHLAELADEPLIMAAVSDSPTRMTNLIAACREAGFKPRIAQRATQTNTAISLVDANLGSMIVTATAHSIGRQNVVLIPIIDMPSNTRHELAMIWLPNRTSQPLHNLVGCVSDFLAANPEHLDMAGQVNLLVSHRA